MLFFPLRISGHFPNLVLQSNCCLPQEKQEVVCEEDLLFHLFFNSRNRAILGRGEKNPEQNKNTTPKIPANQNYRGR